MIKSNNSPIEDLLTEKHLISSVFPSVGTILKKIKGQNSIKLIYGETYDQFGMTIDSLKYYFFLSLLHKLLKNEGVKASSEIIVGDLHSVKNKLVTNKENLLFDANTRLKLINKIKATYNLSIEPRLMSQIFNDVDFKERLSIITPIFRKSEKLIEIARKTVLQNRITQEEKAGYQYILEEVALITGFDVKIGPPREIHYDQLARLLGKNVGNEDFCSLYLKQTYPLGLRFDFFVSHPEIEQYGLTPYKAGSNQLQDNRIILGRTGYGRCEKLINGSFISNNPSLPNPVLDIYVISQMAESSLKNKNFHLDGEIINNPQKLKTETCRSLLVNIIKPLSL
ncbi:hypothetical protein MUP32_02055 [Candidatus Microgenomates bacterium]|nr:hypothetical protein [Candidatus Microgenomates bacterium]